MVTRSVLNQDGPNEGSQDRALDKRVYLVKIRDDFCQFCTKTHVVTPYLNPLDGTVQMSGNNI